MYEWHSDIDETRRRLVARAVDGFIAFRDVHINVCSCNARELNEAYDNMLDVIDALYQVHFEPSANVTV